MKQEMLVGVILAALFGGALLFVFSGDPATQTNVDVIGPPEVVNSPAQSAIGENPAEVVGVTRSPAPVATPKANKGTPYKEIVKPSGFVNTDGKAITIADYIGKKIVLLDVMTYSCINCQRTFPYAVAWYETYKDQGLVIIGIHTPEFAFEKNIKNVEEAMKRFGITFPIVLDNDYGTWNAYGNRYWPRKYLIDIHGNVVYDHIGEGAYEETEQKIQELLKERAEFLGTSFGESSNALVASDMPEKNLTVRSPETYLGSARNEYLGNGTPGTSGEQTFAAPLLPAFNTLYFDGVWQVAPEYAESSSGGKILYRYSAQEVYLVADADIATQIEVWQDGKKVSTERGIDVSAEGIVTIKESRLYKLIKNAQSGAHTLELRVVGGKARFYAFTFG